MSQSCHGCKFLYCDGQGYSDYTWLDSCITCALDLNPDLPVDEPADYDKDMTPTLRFMALMAFECDKYSPGEYITVSPDGNTDGTDDDEQMEAIMGDCYEDWKKGEHRE